MRPGAYGLPNLRRFRLLKISRISQLSAMSLQNCFLRSKPKQHQYCYTKESDIAFMVEASGSYWIRY
jgi:hypothetical protein